MIIPEARGYESQIVDYVVQRRADMKQARSEREGQWLECMESYASKRDANWVSQAIADGRSARALPMMWHHTESTVNQLMAMLFPNEEWFQIKPGRRGGFLSMDDHDAPLIEHLMRTQHSGMKFRAQYKQLLRWLVITGNCPWTMVWHEEQATDYPAYTQAMEEYVQQFAMRQEEFQAAQAEWEQHAQMLQQAGLPIMDPPPEPPEDVPPLPD